MRPSHSSDFNKALTEGQSSFFLTTIPTRIALLQFTPRRAGSVVGEGGESNADHKCRRANLVAREGIGCMSGVPSVQCLRDRRANRARSFSQRIVCQVRITGCRLRLSVAEQFADDRKAQGRRLLLCSHRLCRRSWSRTSRRPAAFRTSSHTAFRL